MTRRGRSVSGDGPARIGLDLSQFEDVMSLLAEVAGYSRFLLGLPTFLRQRVTADSAAAIVRERLRNREANFLATIRRAAGATAVGPYRRLLELAGCELGDVERLVATERIDGCLRALREAGVYLSFEEFKGSRPIVRGSQQVWIRPEDFDNPHLTSFHAVSTGGSTGGARRVLMDLAHLSARLPMILLGDVFHGVFGIPTAFWFEIPPGNGLDSVLQRVPLGNVPERWFTPIRGGGDGAALRFRAATHAAIAVARLSGARARIPWPEHVPLGEARVIAEWMRRALQRSGACGLRAHVSKAVRVCVAAREAGVDLTGAVIVAGGEPPTPAKVAEITRTGARFFSNYYFTEAGPIGASCTTSPDANDQHFYADHLALIQTPREVPGFDVTVPSFHFTTLLPSAPKVLINVESDDFGVVEEGACECPFGALGFTTHVREIRSFRKLTGEGVTLIGSDMEHILEHELPARLGGSSLDYQLVEEEDEGGFTRLTLRVAPSVPLVDDCDAIRVLLDALARRGGAADMARGIWAQAAAFRVRREVPHVTARGKFFPIQLRLPPPGAGSARRRHDGARSHPALVESAR